MTIEYDTLTDGDKLEIADMLSKIESIDALIEKTEGERETANENWRAKDEELQTERAKLKMMIQGKREARITLVK